jgi:tripartite-type tricarboxylate transporter receptor subunit TctC
MDRRRRSFVGLATGAACAATLPGRLLAADYPTRPVRLLVGFPAGSGPDLVARLTGAWLSERLGQSFVIDDRPGAGSNVATEAALQATPDGYTLLLASGSNGFNATLYDRLSFNFTRDITPIASIYRAPNVLVVHPSVPATTLPDFIAHAKANPGKLNMASNGNGSTGHIYGGLFKMMTGVDMVHVPYRDNPLPDLLDGRTQVYFSPISSAAPFIKTGKLRALGVTSPERWSATPEFPTIAQFVPGFEAMGWMGLAASRGAPPEVVETLNREVKAALADETFRRRLADFGGEPFGGTPREFGDFIAAYTEKWAKVIRFAGIRPD